MSRPLVLGTDWANDPLWVTERICDAVVAKARGVAPPEAARPFYSTANFRHLALSCSIARKRDRRRPAGVDIINEELALAGSDFPHLAGEALRKIAAPAYWNANTTFQQIAREIPMADFKEHTYLGANAFPNLLRVNERGEFKYGSIEERGEPILAATHRRIVNLTRQLIINDDLGLLNRLGEMAGQRAADFANQLFFAQCILPNAGLGPDLSDSVPVYDNAHNNVAGSGGLDATRLSDARSKQRSQTTSDGLKLNTPSRFLLVPPGSETLAELTLESLHGDPLEVLSDSNLTGTRFYVLADPSQLSNYAYGYPLVRGPEVTTRTGFSVDGVETRVSLSIGVAAVDYLGGVTGAGA